MVLMLSFGEFTLAKGMPPIGCRIHPPIPIERSPRSKPIINSSVWKNSNLLRRSGANVLQCRLFYLLCFKHVDNWEAYSLPSETGLLISPDFANGSAAISALPRSLACHENKCLESVDRDSFIIFLFYSNLLMGEFERSGMGQKRGIAWALGDIFTAANFEIALIAALIGYSLFECLRKKF
jgi:hypothetical protein